MLHRELKETESLCTMFDYQLNFDINYMKGRAINEFDHIQPQDPKSSQKKLGQIFKKYYSYFHINEPQKGKFT